MKPFALLTQNAPAKPAAGKTEVQRVWINQGGKLVGRWVSVTK